MRQEMIILTKAFRERHRKNRMKTVPKKKTDLHTFVVCAYQNSPYLRDCIRSLKKQTVRSRILITTSTPNDDIKKTAEEFCLQVRVNRGQSGLAGDWNFALSQAETPLVTLAHQDDLYLPEYTQRLVRAFRKNQDAIILFTDYEEIRSNGTDDQLLSTSALLRAKRLMLLPVRVPGLQNQRLVKRSVISLGNAICCPSVTYVISRTGTELFVGNMKSNVDWQAWETLSDRKGSFVYMPQKLMCHRIHNASTTAGLINDHARREEDLYMFRKFWPGKLPELIWKLYGKNEEYQ